MFVADGFRVAHLSYTFGYNGLRLPPGEEWRSALIDPQRIIADATQARQLGAEVVIVSMHWGIEGRRDVTPEQRAVAEQVTASGTVDLIVGHHAHVLQPIEQINGVWVIFGLGNMISNLPTGPRWPAACQDGAVAVVDDHQGAPTARRSSPRRSSIRRGSIGSMAGTSTSCSRRLPTPPFPRVCAPSWRRRYAGPARCSAVFIAA